MIYIACPERIATGGTELLHQLCYKLNLKGIAAKIYYYNKSSDTPTAARFLKYKIEYSENIEDKKENILIVPEVNIKFLGKFNSIKKYIWWLSVDNYKYRYNDYFKFNLENSNTIKEKIKIYFKYIFKSQKEDSTIFQKEGIIHLVQSKYAEEFLKLKGVKKKKITYLSDYINNEFDVKNLNIYERENNILYNPKKGLKITKKIMKLFPKFKYIPIENMTPQEIKEVCLNSKIYIDFGNHPGKDRFPRETANLGCIVLTNKRGAARYFEDVAIPEKYKYDENEQEIKRLGKDIENIFQNYYLVFDEYKNYREKIKREESIFEEELINIFGKK